MTTAEFQRAIRATLDLYITFEQAAEAMRTLSTASRQTADVIAEWSRSARGAKMLKAMKGQQRYEKRMNRQRAEAEPLTGRRTPLPPNPRLAYDAKRLREKRAAEIERVLDEQGRRTQMTSLPVPEPITIQNASTGAEYDVEKLGVRMDGGVDVVARKVVNLDGQMVRIAETPEQVGLDEALYGVVAVKLKP
jgi:hypothetical protein